MQVHLTERLSVIASFVRRDKTVCDVGTDHALLPCYLALRGQEHVIASDINEGPLSSARATMKEYGVTDIELIRSDGLDEITFADDIIVAGMGGELIADIISRCRFLNGELRLILQPMTKPEELRRRMYARGFEIISEAPAFDAGKIYTVIYARYTGENREIADDFAFIGKNTDSRYIEKQLSRLLKMGKGDPHCLEVAADIERKRQHVCT